MLKEAINVQQLVDRVNGDAASFGGRYSIAEIKACMDEAYLRMDAVKDVVDV